MSDLGSFLSALKVAEDRGFVKPHLAGEVNIEQAWDAVALLWAWLDTSRPLPFHWAWLRGEIGSSYEMNSDQTIAYVDTCEIEYLISGSCRHTFEVDEHAIVAA
jgi:hypothetical protein